MPELTDADAAEISSRILAFLQNFPPPDAMSLLAMTCAKAILAAYSDSPAASCAVFTATVTNLVRSRAS